MMNGEKIEGGSELVLVSRAAIENAIATLERDGDEHGVALNLFATLATAAAQHPDDAAVDAFAAALKAKLADARAKGRGGWEDKAECTQLFLSHLLRGHVEKGDPRDVANFCCFLWNRGEGILAAPPLNEPFGNPEQLPLNEPSGDSGQLASLGQGNVVSWLQWLVETVVADGTYADIGQKDVDRVRTFRRQYESAAAAQRRGAVAYPTDSDREVLLYLMKQFDSESCVCSRCGHEEDTASMDSADYLRKYLAEHPAHQSREARGSGGAWFGSDIYGLRSIVLDETGCMVDLALYIASPNDGGPTIRQGRYDAACGFVDSTTGRWIDVDAWSSPGLAVTPQDTAGGSAIATVLQWDPEFPTEGAAFSMEDWKKLGALPVGTRLYTAPPPGSDVGKLWDLVDDLAGESREEWDKSQDFRRTPRMRERHNGRSAGLADAAGRLKILLDTTESAALGTEKASLQAGEGGDDMPAQPPGSPEQRARRMAQGLFTALRNAQQARGLSTVQCARLADDVILMSGFIAGALSDQRRAALPEGRWIAADDVDLLVRQMDVALNGEAGAAKQAHLCDVAAQVLSHARQRGPLLDAVEFQPRVARWAAECFDAAAYGSLTERGDRFLEEVLELLQAHGYDRGRIPTLIDYVYGRPAGEPGQEVGGVMVTLAAFCSVAWLDMVAEGARELARVSDPVVMSRIRAKQEAKRALRFDTPLPGAAGAAGVGAQK